MKVRCIPTKTIKEILNENYTRGKNGKDYGNYREELQAELWERQNKEADLEVKERERQELIYEKEMSKNENR